MKPRSKASFSPPDYARIKGRIERLNQCIEKHQAMPDNPKSADKIARCEASIAEYKSKAQSLKENLDEIAG